jgi:hypothetical protein
MMEQVTSGRTERAIDSHFSFPSSGGLGYVPPAAIKAKIVANNSIHHSLNIVAKERHALSGVTILFNTDHRHAMDEMNIINTTMTTTKAINIKLARSISNGLRGGIVTLQHSIGHRH